MRNIQVDLKDILDLICEAAVEGNLNLLAWYWKLAGPVSDADIEEYVSLSDREGFPVDKQDLLEWRNQYACEAEEVAPS